MSVILFIDDEPDILELAKHIFNKHNHKIITASDGQAGLDIFAKSKDIDIIFCDLQMPIMDGDTFIKNFRKINKTTPVILITGMLRNDEFPESPDDGFDGYLYKPFSINRINCIVNDLKAA